MNDSWTMYRKEMREAFGDRHSMRGAMLQALICIGLTGVIVPLFEASIWTNITTTLTLYVVFPATFAASLSADAFAGERERRTLETLLATPLADHSIFIGKAATAVTFVMAVSATSLLGAIIATASRGMLASFAAITVFGTLISALSSALLITAVAIAIAARTPVARSAQQLGSLATFALAGITVSLLRHLRIGLTWPTVLRIDILVLLAGAVALFVAMQRFHRERFFESR